jgi:hypothetical protein
VALMSPLGFEDYLKERKPSGIGHEWLKSHSPTFWINW